MAVPTAATGVLSLPDLKAELRLPSSERDLDTLLNGIIDQSVKYVQGRISRPLLATNYRMFLNAFPPADCPIYIPSRYVSAKGDIHYWSDGASLNQDSDRTIDSSALGRIVPVVEDYAYAYGGYGGNYANRDGYNLYWPDTGWPTGVLAESRIIVNFQRGWPVTDSSIKQACIVAARDLFEGQRMQDNTTLDMLLQPWIPYGHPRRYIPPTGLVVQPTPTPPPVTTRTIYIGWSDDNMIDASDLAGAGTTTTTTGTIPDRQTNGYLWFAVDQRQGYPTILYLAGDRTSNELPAFTRQAGTVDDANGDPHIVAVSHSQLFALAYANEAIEFVF